jgi:hypothetical protein
MEIIRVADPYATSAAFGFQADKTQMQHINMMSNMALQNNLTETGQMFYQDIQKINNYLSSDAIVTGIEKVTENLSNGLKDFEIYKYTEDTFMNVNPYMKQVVMANPYLHSEFVDGNISGFNVEDDRYDEDLYESVVGGTGDHLNDTSIYADSSEMETGIDTYMKVQDVWEFYIKSLDNDDDFTDI